MTRACVLLVVFFSVAVAGEDCTQSIQVSVVDKDTSKFIGGLSAEALEAKAGKTPLLVTALEPIRSRRILILFDESGSMSERPGSSFSYQGQALRLIKQTLNDLANELPRGVSIQYGMFNNKTVIGERFLTQPAELKQSMQEVEARLGKIGVGQTALYDALHEALSRFQPPESGDSVLLITDGGDNHSQLFAKNLRKELQTANVRLLTILFRSSESSLEIAGPLEVRELVASSGGFSLEIDPSSYSWADKKSIATKVQIIRAFWYGIVLRGYIAQLKIPATLTQGKWSLLVKQDRSPNLKKATAIYPNHLNACPNEALASH